MKIVVAIDSFKGSASSLELGQAVKTGILSADPDLEVKVFEIADGGEGTLSALKQALTGEMIKVETFDLLNRSITAEYLLCGEQAFIETADVIGLDKIIPSSETFEQATTFGLATLIKDATRRKVKEIYLTLGGSATSDGGRGLLEGLGLKLDELDLIPKLPKLIGLVDVDNPYAGPQGYAYGFGQQKGGTREALAQEDANAKKFAAFVKQKLGLDLQAIPGTGAAGGLGGAITILGGQLEAGFAKIAELLKVEAEIASCDLVITGEGRIDAQSAHGKLVWGIASMAEVYHVPVVALCGAISDDLAGMAEHLTGIYSIQSGPISLEMAMVKETTLNNIRRLSKNIVKTWLA